MSRHIKIELYYQDPAALGTRIQQILERHGKCTLEKKGEGVLVRVPKEVLKAEHPSITERLFK